MRKLFRQNPGVEAKKVAGGQNGSVKQADEAAAPEKQAEEVRRQLEKVEASMKRKRGGRKTRATMM